jgi:hypothetical protein
MGNTFITDEGKNKMLELTFGASNSNNNTFNNLALGGSNSSAVSSQNKSNFKEVSGNDYSRVSFDTVSASDKQIILSAIFGEDNYTPIDGETIKEIGIVNSATPSTANIFFGFAEVPEIVKKSSVSIAYEIIVEIE